MNNVVHVSDGLDEVICCYSAAERVHEVVTVSSAKMPGGFESRSLVWTIRFMSRNMYRR